MLNRKVQWRCWFINNQLLIHFKIRIDESQTKTGVWVRWRLVYRGGQPRPWMVLKVRCFYYELKKSCSSPCQHVRVRAQALWLSKHTQPLCCVFRDPSALIRFSALHTRGRGLNSSVVFTNSYGHVSSSHAVVLSISLHCSCLCSVCCRITEKNLIYCYSSVYLSPALCLYNYHMIHSISTENRNINHYRQNRCVT